MGEATDDRASVSPRVSVVLPVYNAMPYLDAAVASVLGQSLRGLELIAINDGSSDRSGDCLRAWAAKDGRVRLVDRENRGLVATLNEGIAMAQAPLIARMDGDDLCEPERLERQAAYLWEHPGVVACGTQAVIIDRDSRPYHNSDYPVGHNELETALLQGRCLVFHPSVMMRADVVIGVGGYRAGLAPRSAVDLCEDLDLWLRLMEHGRMVNLPERLMRYRRHPGSITGRHAEAQRACSARVVREACVARGLDADAVVSAIAPLQPRASTPDALAALAFRSGYRRTGWHYIAVGLWRGPGRGRGACLKLLLIRLLGRRLTRVVVAGKRWFSRLGGPLWDGGRSVG